MTDTICNPQTTLSFADTAAALRAEECAVLKHDTVIGFLEAAHRRELQDIANVVKDLVQRTESPWLNTGRNVFDGDDVGSIICEFETGEQASLAVGCVNAVRRLRKALKEKGYSV